MRVAKAIELDDARPSGSCACWRKRRRVEARLQQRAQVVLLAAQGWQNKDIAVEVDLDRRQVALWRQRFLDGGVDALRTGCAALGRARHASRPRWSRASCDATLHDKPVSGHALEHAHAGRAPGRGRHHHPPRLAAATA